MAARCRRSAPGRSRAAVGLSLTASQSNSKLQEMPMKMQHVQRRDGQYRTGRGGHHMAVQLFLFAGLAHSWVVDDQVIYSDSLQNSWEPWGWAVIDYSNSSPVHTGSRCIAVTFHAAWDAIYLHHAPFDVTPYTHLTFWAHGGNTGGQKLQAQALLGGTAQAAVPLPALSTNQGAQMTIPLTELGVAGQPNLDGFWIQDTSGAAAPTFYLDDIRLTTLVQVQLTAPLDGESFAAGATIRLAANVSANGHIINAVQFYNGSTVPGEDAT